MQPNLLGTSGMGKNVDKRRHCALGRGFSMLELVIVIVILGIIAAIAIPRLSRGSEGAAEGALKADLRVLREALELYRAEHDGALPPGDKIDMALLGYSDRANTMFGVDEAGVLGIIYGPYVRYPPPSLPVGRRKGAVGISIGTDVWVGWVYDPAAGTITANCDNDEKDAAGVPYNKY